MQDAPPSAPHPIDYAYTSVSAASTPHTAGIAPAGPSSPSPSPSASSSESPFSRLPPELIAYLLTHIPPDQLQRTTLALHKVFPHLNLAEQFLWRHVTVRKGEQLMPLWRAAKVRGTTGGVRSFTMESWKGDADILNNALRCLPKIPVLSLNMGTNFAPEHLEEAFEDPRPDLERLELTFRPYVEHPSYYQFLKGSYFDTAIETLSRSWPETPAFTCLSVVQDIPPRGTAPPTALHSVVPSTVATPTVSRIASATTSVAPSAAPSVVPSAAQSTAPSKAPSAAASKLNSPYLGPTPSPLSVTAVASQMADLALDSSSSDSDEDESSGHSTPPTSTSEDPVEPKGYSGYGPFPYLGEKLAWARPKSFAQPIVFFDIKCIARFGAAPVAKHLTHLRLRVPSRDLASVLTLNTRTPLFPSLTYLDISTTNVRLDTTLSALFKTYGQLEHLVLDRVNLFSFQAKDRGMDMCRELGGMVLSACLARGKERERAIAAWDIAERTRIAVAEASRRGETSTTPGGAEPHPAATGPATATSDFSIQRARRGQRSAAISTFSLRDRPSRLRASASSSSSTTSNVQLAPTDKLYLVLPALPSLRTLCIGGEAHHIPPHRVREWTNEFHSGWREGLGKVMGWAGHVGERYERARKKADEWVAQELRAAAVAGKSATGGNGKGKGKAAAKASIQITRPPTDVRLFRFPLPGEKPTSHLTADDGDAEAVSTRDDPTRGLIELFPTNKEYLDPYKSAIADAEAHANDHSFPAPCVLCTVPDCEGPSRKGDEGGRVDGRGGMEGVHTVGCGHEVGRRTWGWEGM